MKKIIPLLFAAFLTACSSMIPYKNQNLDYLHGIEQNPDEYRGKVVSFGGKVKGVTEDARRARLIIKIDVPLYYYATGKDPLSYELLLISFDKKGMPQMTGIQKGNEVKVLARAANYETRKNLTGKPIAVLHLIAFALADRTRNKDFFRPEPPYKQLYESWKEGKLFFKEQPQEIEAKFPAGKRKTMSFFPLPAATVPPQPAEKPKGIVYDEEEPAFILPPDPKPEPKPEPEPEAEPRLEAEPEPPPETAPDEEISAEKTAAEEANAADSSEPGQPSTPNAATADIPAKDEQPTKTSPAEKSPAAAQTEAKPVAAPEKAELPSASHAPADTPAFPILHNATQETSTETPQEDKKLSPQEEDDSLPAQAPAAHLQ